LAENVGMTSILGARIFLVAKITTCTDSHDGTNQKPGYFRSESGAPGAASRYGEIDRAFDQTRQARTIGFSCADETIVTRIGETLKRDSDLQNSNYFSPRRSRGAQSAHENSSSVHLKRKNSPVRQLRW
jgi:hypothetical protein